MAPPGHAVLPRDSRPSGQKKPRAAPGPSPPLPRNGLRAWERLEAGSDGAFIGNDLCLPPGGKTGAAVHVLTCTRRARAHGPEHRNPPRLAENKGQRAGMGQRAGLWAGDKEGGSRTDLAGKGAKLTWGVLNLPHQLNKHGNRLSRSVVSDSLRPHESQHTLIHYL